MDHRIVMDVIAFAVRSLDTDPFIVLPFEFDPADPEDEPLAPLAFPCAVYHDDPDNEAFATQYAERHAKHLTQSEREWIAKQCQTRLSVYEVTAVRPGESLSVTDLLTGVSHEIPEQLASQSVRVHQHLLMRVVVHEDLALMCGVHPVTFGPSQALTIIKEFKRTTRVRTKRVAPAKLASFDLQTELLLLWHEIASEPVQMPMLTNTDGDELLPTVDKFRFAPQDHAAVLEALRKMKGMHAVDETPEPGAPHTLSWSKPGERMDSLGVAFLSVRKDRLDVETNSIARADAAKTAVLEAAGSLVRFFGRTHSDIEAMMRENAGEPRPPKAPPSREMITAMQTLKDEHYRAWIDEAIPALNNETPRNAVQTAAGKQRVITLLKDLELVESSHPAAERYDIAWMWSALGLK
jgi:hypothetical protein